MYGSIKVTYRDDTVKTYDTFIGHLVKYEQQFGTFEETSTSAARLGWLVSDSPLPFDEWLGGVKYIVPVIDMTPSDGDAEDGPDGDGDAEPVPTQ